MTSKLAHRAPGGLPSPAVRSLTSLLCNTFAQTAIRDLSLLHFPKPFPTPFPVDEFGHGVPAFSTLSTPSTVFVLNRPESP
jgi:hypothetical protein